MSEWVHFSIGISQFFCQFPCGSSWSHCTFLSQLPMRCSRSRAQCCVPGMKLGVTLSAKTALMQQRFLITLVMQVGKKLILQKKKISFRECCHSRLFSYPYHCFSLGLLSGRELPKLTSLISFGYLLLGSDHSGNCDHRSLIKFGYLLCEGTTLQACVSLSLVTRGLKSSSPALQKNRERDGRNYQQKHLLNV